MSTSAVLKLLLCTTLLLNAANSSTVPDCPTGCTCRAADNGNTDIAVIVRCFAIPNSLPDRANLTVSGTTLAKLRDADLQGVRNVVALYLTGLNITTLELSVRKPFTNLQTLSLSGNRLVRIGVNAFDWCPRLASLDLSHNGIKNVSVGAFGGLTSLVRISLAFNKLDDLDPNALPASLIWLDLAHNLLDNPNRLPATDDGRFGKLRHLDLCGNNLHSYVVSPNRAPGLSSLCLGDEMDSLRVDNEQTTPEGAFDSLTSLSVVAKSENGSEAMLRTVTRFRNLRALSLTNFHVDMINDHAVSGFHQLVELRLIKVATIVGFQEAALMVLAPRLQLLDLAGSVILARSLLHPEEFNTSRITLPELRYLSVAGTGVTGVPPGFVTNLTALNLANNPLVCDSSLTEILALVLAGQLQLIGSAECASPSDLAGLRVTDPRVVLRVLSGSAPAYDSSNGTLSEYLDTWGVTRLHLFYMVSGLIVLVLFLLMSLLIVCYMRRRRGGRRDENGRRGCCGSAGGSDGSGEGFMMRADSEYTFDNFTLSDTLSESRRAAAAASRDSTLTKGRKHSNRK